MSNSTTLDTSSTSSTSLKTNLLSLCWTLTSCCTVIIGLSAVLRKYLGLRIVGLTGGISSGKSTCSEYLKSRGIKIIDFDTIAHDVYAVGRPTWSAIRKEFGDDILNSDWTINRKKLGAIVWKDKKKLKKLTKVKILKKKMKF